MNNYKAHYDKYKNIEQSIADHLKNVSELAKFFAEKLGGNLAALAEIAGLLHDIGKYGDLFQKRIMGEQIKVDHSSAGAKLVYEKYGNQQLAAVIEAHHTGLKTLNKKSLIKILETNFSPSREGIKVSEALLDILYQRFEADGFGLPSQLPSCCSNKNGEGIKEMLDTRLLLSCLVDADYYDTSVFFEEQSTLTPQTFRHKNLDQAKLQPAIQCLEARVKAAQSESMSGDVQKVRNTLLADCNAAAQKGRGFFSLTAPTGSGKTISMMSFALRHAEKHGMDRVIVALPFLSIIDQNAKDYESVFQSLGSDFVLQHHSLAMQRTGDNNVHAGNGYFVENWNSEIVVTTNVQLLESLFSDMPSACRKLHRITNSVIIFDEIQSLPSELVAPTLAALDHLVKRYGCSVVFSTATQPQYQLLHNELGVLGVTNYKAEEIVQDPKRMFADMVRVEYRYLPTPMNWTAIAVELAKQQQVLCIVNLKRDVASVYNELLQLGVDDNDIFCLSTNLCPSHRLKVIAEVQQRLKSGQKCIFVSTQCIEAGVNVDFPSVWRVAGPLEAILQAGGRCNRHGLMGKKGEVVVFKHTGWSVPVLYPSQVYYSATMTTLNILDRKKDLSNPATIREYYSLFYNRSGVASGKLPDFKENADGRNFEKIKRDYKLISDDHIRVLVPYDFQEFEAVRNKSNSGLTAKWVRKAQATMVNTRRPKPNDKMWNYLQAVLLRDGSPSDEYFILTALDRYHQKHGLQKK